MAGWHHWLDGRESQWTLGVGDGQGGLACCDSWGCKESDTTERLIWSDLTHILFSLFNSSSTYIWASQVPLVMENLPANAGDIKRWEFIPGFWKTPWRRAWKPTPVVSAGKSLGQRNLAGYSPLGHKEVDMIEATWHQLVQYIIYLKLHIPSPVM